MFLPADQLFRAPVGASMRSSSLGFLRLIVAMNFWWLGSAIAASAALTIATYNVENYLVADRLVDGVYREAYPKPEGEKTALRQVIKTMNADVLTIQEMGTQLFLDELQRDLKTDGVNYPYAALLEAADPERHVAVLSKMPFKQISPHAAVPVRLRGKRENVKRGVLELSFATNEGELTLFVIHLKSRRTEQEDDLESRQQRLVEAEAVRDLLLGRFPDPTQAKFLICGDWNDTRNSKPVKSLQKRGEVVLGEIVRAADSRGENWTHCYRKEDTYSRIDYLLVSPALKSFIRNGHGQVWDGPGVTEASDHRPVLVTLNLNAIK